ncbi:MAG: DMT family transporter, partial [Bacteroidota bacterium]|nr:DMT family transporter [Bacteroidota bacterium]
MTERAKGHILILLTNVIFGINTPLAKDTLNVVGPHILSTLRFVGCALLFWVASWIFRTPKTEKKDIPIICLASLFGIVFNLFLFILGLSYTSPTNASIIISMTPIFTMIMSAIFLKEPLSFKKVVGVLCGLTGALILIFAKTQNTALLPKNNILGIVFCLISCVAYALYLTLFSNVVKRNHPINVMKWMFLTSAIVILPITWNKVTTFDYSILTTKTCLEIAYVVCLATFLNYNFIPMAQARLRPTTLSMYNYVQPVVTTLLSVILLMETLTIYKIFAALLIFLGVYIVTTSKSKRG